MLVGQSSPPVLRTCDGCARGAQVWTFGNGPDPTSITVDGVEVFRIQPLTELDVAGGGYGGVTWGAASITATDPAGFGYVDLAASGSRSGVNVTATMRLWYDGDLDVVTTISAAGSSTVKHRWTMHPSASADDLYVAHVTYNFATLNIEKGDLLEAAGPYPSAPVDLDWRPSFAALSDTVGIEWWSESNGYYLPANQTAETPLRYGKSAGNAFFEVETLALATDLSADVVHTYSLSPSPARPRMTNFRTPRLTSVSGTATTEPEAETGLRWINPDFSQDYAQRYWGLPSIVYDGRWEAQVAERAAMTPSQELMLYVWAGFSPALHPVAMANASSWSHQAPAVTWHKDQSPTPNYNFARVASLSRTGARLPDFQSNVDQRYFPCGQAFADFMVREYAKGLAEMPLYGRPQPAGLWVDHGNKARMCESDPRLTNPSVNGTEAWDFYAFRSQLRRVHEARDLLAPAVSPIAGHTNGMPRALLKHHDVAYIGESLNVPFGMDAGTTGDYVSGCATPPCDGTKTCTTGALDQGVGGCPAANPSDCHAYCPDYVSVVADDTLRAYLAHAPGSTMGLLPQLKYALDTDGIGHEGACVGGTEQGKWCDVNGDCAGGGTCAAEAPYWLRNHLGAKWLFCDVLDYQANLGVESSAIWRALTDAYDQFGSVLDAEMACHPYFANGSLLAESSGLLATARSHPNEVGCTLSCPIDGQLVVVNPTAAAVSGGTVTLSDLAGLGMTGATQFRIYDPVALTWGSWTNLVGGNQVTGLNVPAKEFVLVEVN